MNAPAIFAFNAAAVRVFNIENAPWFMASDISGILGYRDAEKMTRMLDEDEKDTHLVGTLGGDQTVSIISESGLYNATFKSNRPEAKALRKWVTSELLPSLRKNGYYIMPGAAPDFRISNAEVVPEYSNPLSLNHRADITVSADRTFRAMMRSGRAAGLPLPNALRRANEITIQKTGVDMLGELGVEVPLIEPVQMKQDFYGIARFFEAWAGNTLPVPYTACKTTDFYRAYCLWAKQAGADVLHNGRFFVKAREHEVLAKKTMTEVVYDDRHNKARLMMPTGLRMKVAPGEFGRYLGKEIERFARALEQWESAA